MSGHSKWHNIQKTKGAADAKRSQIFTKIAREMIVAVKTGGSGDPANNSRLATVVAKAKAANMPNDNIKRTIEKALGSGNTDSFESVVYEGYGGFNTKKNFKWCKQDKAVIMAFKPSDVRSMLRSCKGYGFLQVRDAAVLTALFETGIRCWELCCIRKQDIHDDFIIINGKNHKQRVVPITPVLRKALLKYDNCAAAYFTLKNTDDYYFLSFHGRQLTNSAVEHIIKRHGAGIEGIRVSPHTCRHFFAQQQIKMGTDLYTISRLLGHENIQITQTYLNSLRDDDIIQIAKQKSVLMSM